MAEIVWSLCEEKPEMTKVFFRYMFAPACGVEAAMILGIIFLFIAKKMRGKLKTQTPVFIGTMLIFVCSFLVALTAAVCYHFVCLEGHFPVFAFFYGAGGQVYAMQYLMLVALLYGRLYFAFKDSAMQLSARTNSLFYWFYAFIILASLPGAYFYIVHPTKHISLILITGVFVLWLLSIICLVFVFLRRLRTVFAHSKDETMKAAITKASLLAVMSLINSFVAFSLLLTALVAEENFYLIAATPVAVLLDCLVNSVCVLLMFKNFAFVYRRLCGCCDRQWGNMWQSTYGSTVPELAVNSSSSIAIGVSKTNGSSLAEECQSETQVEV